MSSLIPAVIASTHKYFQPERTQIIYRPSTVKEVVKQVNQYKIDGVPMRVFLHPPSKSDSANAQSPLMTSLKQLVASREETKDDKAVIGFVRACDEKMEGEETQAHALIEIKIEEVRASIEKNKSLLCFVLQVQFDPSKSFEKISGGGIMSSVLQVDERAGKMIKYLIPPIKCLWLHVSLKNSQSNPYVRIL